MLILWIHWIHFLFKLITFTLFPSLADYAIISLQVENDFFPVQKSKCNHNWGILHDCVLNVVAAECVLQIAKAYPIQNWRPTLHCDALKIYCLAPFSAAGYLSEGLTWKTVNIARAMLSNDVIPLLGPSHFSRQIDSFALKEPAVERSNHVIKVLETK